MLPAPADLCKSRNMKLTVFWPCAFLVALALLAPMADATPAPSSAPAPAPTSAPIMPTNMPIFCDDLSMYPFRRLLCFVMSFIYTV